MAGAIHFGFELLLAQAIGSQTILAGFMVGVGVLLIIAGVPGARRWMRSKRSATTRTSATRSPAAQSRDAKTLARDLEELTRLCASTIDKKAARIETLLERADVVIARLEELGEDLAEPSTAEEKARIGVRRVRHGAGVRRPESALASIGGEIDPLAREIYQLADTGKSPVEIASALEEHVGKVELILALRS